jgi:ribosomal protein L19E
VSDIDAQIRVAEAEAEAEKAERERRIAEAVAAGGKSQAWVDASTPQEIKQALAKGELDHLL